LGLSRRQRAPDPGAARGRLGLALPAGPLAPLLLQRPADQAPGRAVAEVRARQPLALADLRRLRHLGDRGARTPAAARLVGEVPRGERPPRLGPAARTGGHLRAHRGDAEGVGNSADQTRAEAADAPPPPALARGSLESRLAGRTTAAVAAPLDSWA